VEVLLPFFNIELGVEGIIVDLFEEAKDETEFLALLLSDTDLDTGDSTGVNTPCLGLEVDVNEHVGVKGEHEENADLDVANLVEVVGVFDVAVSVLV
jgi:hypothetical protein